MLHPQPGHTLIDLSTKLLLELFFQREREKEIDCSLGRQAKSSVDPRQSDPSWSSRKQVDGQIASYKTGSRVTLINYLIEIYEGDTSLGERLHPSMVKLLENTVYFQYFVRFYQSYQLCFASTLIPFSLATPIALINYLYFLWVVDFYNSCVLHWIYWWLMTHSVNLKRLMLPGTMPLLKTVTKTGATSRLSIRHFTLCARGAISRTLVTSSTLHRSSPGSSLENNTNPHRMYAAWSLYR